MKSITQTDIEFSKKVAVENGLFNIETLELKPFTLETMVFHQIEAAYSKEATCAQWEAFLKDVLPDEKDRLLLQEWSGYLLLPDYRFHKLLWIHGVGRNGKGVWQRTMEAILGEQNVSGVGLEELDGNHRFAVHQLYGALFNPCSEPTTNRILQTALLKKVTGQDLIEAEAKGKQKRIKFRNTAKFTIIANKFPKVRDSTVAFEERRLFLTFPMQFTGKDCIPNIERNWLNDPIERMGILNWMLEGLRRLLANGCFTLSKSQEETELAFERASDTIQAFIKEIAIFDKNLVTTRSDAYTAYKEYCDYYGLDNESDKKFTQRLKETPRITATKIRTPKQERAWKGLGLKKIDDIDGTDGTDFKGNTPLYNFNNTDNKKSGECVKSVPSVPIKNCGHCTLFRTPGPIGCEADNWETRNGNAKPLTNWCFKPKTYSEAS